CGSKCVERARADDPCRGRSIRAVAANCSLDVAPRCAPTDFIPTQWLIEARRSAPGRDQSPQAIFSTRGISMCRPASAFEQGSSIEPDTTPIRVLPNRLDQTGAPRVGDDVAG